jgi:hypothetical protein
MMNQFWTGHVFIHFILNFLRGPTLGSLIIDIFLHLPQLGNFTRGAWTDKRCPFLPLKMTLSFGQMLFNQHIMASQLVNTKLCERMCADFQPNDLVSNFRVIYIYTYADWLTEWGMLRARLHFLLCTRKQKVRMCSEHSSFSQSVSMRDYYINIFTAVIY